MRILAIDFSSSQRSVAVVDNLAGAISEHEAIETGGRATGTFGMAEQVLRAAGIEREQIDALAIGLGPGSYTGIRAAIAVAQGWQFAAGVKLVGIGAVPCLTEQARTEGLQGQISFVIDAQRREFYLTTWRIEDGRARETGPLRLASLEEVRERERRGDILAGPDVAKWFPGSRPLFPRASTLGRLALQHPEFVASDKLEPIYLREVSFVKAPPPRSLPES